MTAKIIAHSSSKATGGPALRRVVKSALLWTGLSLVIVAGLIGFAVALLGGGHAGLLALQAWSHSVKPILSLVRLALIVCLWWKWDALIYFLVRTGRLQPSLLDPVLKLRARLIMSLLCAELLMVHGFPFSVWH
jgi:hypothetical protein